MILKCLQVLLIIATAFIPLMAETKIVETATVKNIIPFVDKDTWVLVDLDNTTFEGKQALGHTEWFYEKAHAKMREGMTLEEATRACYPEWIEIQKVCPVKPVEPAFIPELIQLQNCHDGLNTSTAIACRFDDTSGEFIGIEFFA
jgi:Protein of unknown function (DUF2608)